MPGLIRGTVRAARAAVRRALGVRYEVCGLRFRFEPGTEPWYLALRDNPVQSENLRQLESWGEALKANGTTFDVGAFIGLYSLIAAARSRSRGRVFAFEPSPDAAAALRRNLRRNGLGRAVEVVEAAAGARAGTALLEQSPLSSENRVIRGPIAAAGRGAPISVEVVELDSFAARRDAWPDLVKIDVEGEELSVLRGMRQILESKATVFCELHPQLYADRDAELREVSELLEARGRRACGLDGSEGRLDRYGVVVLRPFAR